MCNAKVSNMKNNFGRAIPNQFIIEDDHGETFQSYDSIIGKRLKDGSITLDKKYHNYSNTTTKYRNRFLGMTSKEVDKAIKDKSIKLDNLN